MKAGTQHISNSMCFLFSP
ncbi:hypothetical protein CSUI_008022, partial [Cystoisospora suis]